MFCSVLPCTLFLPIPLGRLHLASVLALTMAACAASTEVVNPKDRSIRSTSLSIVWEERVCKERGDDQRKGKKSRNEMTKKMGVGRNVEVD
jgi:hypothetical protein